MIVFMHFYIPGALCVFPAFSNCFFILMKPISREIKILRSFLKTMKVFSHDKLVLKFLIDPKPMTIKALKPENVPILSRIMMHVRDETD